MRVLHGEVQQPEVAKEEPPEAYKRQYEAKPHLTILRPAYIMHTYSTVCSETASTRVPQLDSTYLLVELLY
jgi:hypothetical protein